MNMISDKNKKKHSRYNKIKEIKENPHHKASNFNHTKAFAPFLC